MATCKDCLHVEICKFKDLPAPLSDSYIRESECIEKRCGDFKDRSRFVELPCKVGNKLYLSIESRDKMLNVLGGLYTDPELFEIVPEKQIKQALAQQAQRNNTN